MAKIKLTKNELKYQKDNLKRFTRYLPTLELKKQQLLQEIRRIQRETDALQDEYDRIVQEVSRWVGVFAEDVGLADIIAVDRIDMGKDNVAGIDIPTFENIHFADRSYDLFRLPLWLDAAVKVCKEQIRIRAQQDVAQKQQDILQEELRVTIQRIKLFEEVKIPEAKESIRVIQIFLGDLQTAEVVRGKIAKNKIQRKRQASRTS
jgi:V/A-type H+-transporting ATPase subunit D